MQHFSTESCCRRTSSNEESPSRDFIGVGLARGRRSFNNIGSFPAVSKRPGDGYSSLEGVLWPAGKNCLRCEADLLDATNYLSYIYSAYQAPGLSCVSLPIFLCCCHVGHSSLGQSCVHPDLTTHMTDAFARFEWDFLRANTWPQRKDGVSLDLLDRLSPDDKVLAEDLLIAALGTGTGGRR